MADVFSSKPELSRTARILGTAFLLFQLLFAANNFGPHRIVILNLFFDEPWVKPDVPRSVVGDMSVRLENVSEASGLARFRRPFFNDADPLYLEVMGGGVAVGDYDGDGWEDVFFTGMPDFHPNAPPAPTSGLFRNRGDGTFEDAARAAGLSELKGYPQGALFFDYDNDGDPDLYVAAYDGGQFFQNDAGVFTKRTSAAGLDLRDRCGELPCFGSSASAADYNRDGYLDLLVVNNVHWDLDNKAHHGQRNLFPAFFHSQPTFLFKNNGDGTFTDVSRATGVTNAGGKGLAAVWLDANNDRWSDVYIANDLSHNTLYVNRGNGTFEQVGKVAGVDEIKSSMGVSAGDFNSDGMLDLAVTNLKGSKISLFRNLGDLRFDYASDYAGLASSAKATGWGIEFVDLDLDGHLDLVSGGGPVWERNPADARHLVFRNTGGKFVDVTETSGDIYGRFVSRGLAVLDYDNDGRPDLVFAHVDGGAPLLLKNYPLAKNHRVKILLQGTDSNRDGVGARVELRRTDGHRLVQEVRAGSSYQSTSTRALFFGLGTHAVEAVIVQWPSGTVDTLRAVPTDRTVLIREGRGRVESF